MYNWIKTASGWTLGTQKHAGAVGMGNMQPTREQIMRAGELCKYWAQALAAGNQDILHELEKVPPLELPECNSEDSLDECKNILDHFCEEMLEVMHATDTPIRGWRGASGFLQDAMSGGKSTKQ